MKKRILIAIYIILIIIILKLFFTTIVNDILIDKYNKGEYSENQAKLLMYINFPQSYIANYNYGNILYQKGEYEQAIEQYKNALKGIIPKNKECSIRINYALSICKTVTVDKENQESIEKAIETYQSAIEVLTEKGCANKNDTNGHNQNAEQLKKDIQNEINNLKNIQNNEKEDQSEKNNNKDTQENETIKDKIQDIKEQATQEQRKQEEFYKNYNKDFKKEQKNW